jgi:catalase
MLDAGNKTYVKFHFKTAQGIRNFTNDEAAQMKAHDMDFAQRDLLENIDAGNFPKWDLKFRSQKNMPIVKTIS